VTCRVSPSDSVDPLRGDCSTTWPGRVSSTRTTVSSSSFQPFWRARADTSASGRPTRSGTSWTGTRIRNHHAAAAPSTATAATTPSRRRGALRRRRACGTGPAGATPGSAARIVAHPCIGHERLDPTERRRSGRGQEVVLLGDHDRGPLQDLGLIDGPIDDLGAPGDGVLGNRELVRVEGRDHAEPVDPLDQAQFGGDLGLVQGGDQGERLGPGHALRRSEQGDLDLRGVGALLGIEPAGPLQGAPQSGEVVGDLEIALGSQRQRAGGGVRSERHPGGDALDEHQCQAVDVGATVEATTHRLLRRRVAGGAEHGSARFGPRSFGQRPGHTEVGQSQPAVGVEQQVPGLDVAVHQPAPMSVGQGAGRVEADHQGLAGAERTTPVENASQAPAAEVLGDQVRLHALVGLVLAPVVHGDDVGVVERPGGPSFGAEPPQERVVRGQRRVQQLDRNPASQLGVDGQEDPRRGADSDRGHQAVPPAQLPSDLRDGAVAAHRRARHASRWYPPTERHPGSRLSDS
jgi:hypothetical protein